MEHTLKLITPIMINGASVKELKYDTSKIGALLFAQADARRQQNMDLTKPSATLGMEFDYTMHMYLGFAAIIVANDNQIDWMDLERLQGADLVHVIGIGRNFTYGRAELPQNSSDDSSENTPEPTTPVSQSSTDCPS